MSAGADRHARRTTGSRRRRWAILGAGGVLTLAAIVMALFQPWKLWVDDKVDEAVPVGAAPITARVAATEPPAPASTATTTTTSMPTVTPPSGTAAAPEVTAATDPEPSATTTPATVAPTTVPVLPAGGAFVSIDHGTSGMVVLLEDATGTQFVRLENLDTSNGPDLFVYMSTNPPDGPEGQFDDDYVNLGRLEGNVGSSNYVIPADTDLSRYASIVIWCARFNSAFGAAPLS